MTDFTRTRAFFHLPENLIYMDGNSLGPLPRKAMERLSCTVEKEWGEMLIRAWNRAGWMELPDCVGDRIAGLIGAPKGSVAVGETLSIKVYQALSAALSLRPERKVILSDSGNFPSDLYIAQGLIDMLGRGHQLKIVRPEEVAEEIDAIGEDLAALLLTEVDYRTGRRHDMAALTQRAHRKGALAIWDLAHSAGALPVDVTTAEADFAVGCTYKYLNGGPGAPAFIHVAERHIRHISPALQGWLGHADPFAFEPDYRPAEGIARMRVGTPPILQLAALDAALEIWEEVDIHELRARAIALSELFIARVEARCPMLTLASPRNPEERGSQVSFRFKEGYAAMQAIIDRGVIGDFRAPDIMRFGITPLYLDEADMEKAARIIADVMNNRLWDAPEYRARAPVT